MIERWNFALSALEYASEKEAPWRKKAAASKETITLQAHTAGDGKKTASRRFEGTRGGPVQVFFR